MQRQWFDPDIEFIAIASKLDSSSVPVAKSWVIDLRLVFPLSHSSVHDLRSSAIVYPDLPLWSSKGT